MFRKFSQQLRSIETDCCFTLFLFTCLASSNHYIFPPFTGLKHAVETVNDYNPLMKDFPLNDLLSASELDKIRQALMAIFTHLKKIRNTKYPIQRALRLVEAISRDLSSQLLKVLGTRKLMHVAYEEFEKVSVAQLRGQSLCCPSKHHASNSEGFTVK